MHSRKSSNSLMTGNWGNSAAMFAGAMLWQLFLPGGLVPGLDRPAGEIREGWLEGPGGRAAAVPAGVDEKVAQVISSQVNP